MKKNKRIIKWAFIGIVLVIIVLVALKIWTAFSAPNACQPDDNPDDIAFNYQMALIKENYQRAYGYLSSTLENYLATIDIFVEELEDHELLPVLEMNPCIYVEDVNTAGNNAKVELREQFYDPCTSIKVHNLSYDLIIM